MSTTTEAPSAYTLDSRVVPTTDGASFPFGDTQYFVHPAAGTATPAVAAQGRNVDTGDTRLRAVPEVDSWTVVDADGNVIAAMVGDLDDVLAFFLGSPR